MEEGLWDMAREVVRAYEAGEMPKGSEGGFCGCVLGDVCLVCSKGGEGACVGPVLCFLCVRVHRHGVVRGLLFLCV